MELAIRLQEQRSTEIDRGRGICRHIGIRTKRGSLRGPYFVNDIPDRKVEKGKFSLQSSESRRGGRERENTTIRGSSLKKIRRSSTASNELKTGPPGELSNLVRQRLMRKEEITKKKGVIRRRCPSLPHCEMEGSNRLEKEDNGKNTAKRAKRGSRNCDENSNEKGSK